MRAMQSLRHNNNGYYCTLVWGHDIGKKSIPNVATLYTGYYKQGRSAQREMGRLRNKLGFKIVEIVYQTKEGA